MRWSPKLLCNFGVRIVYKIHFLKAVRKDLKRLSKQASSRIVNFYIPKLSKNPRLGLPLTGVFKGCFKYVIKFKGISYRIVYQIFEKEKVILILAIGPREKFYERLLKRLR